MSSAMLPKYSTILFTDVWDNVEDFKSDLAESPFAGSISTADPDSVSLVFYLLYARYGNSPLALTDIMQFKFRVFSIIFQYGPSWEKRLDIQSKLRELTEADIISGSKAIYNNALNPSTAPSTSALEELTYINSQNTTNFKKSKMEAYAQLWDLIATDVTEEFLVKFKKCFKVFISSEKPLLYVTEEDESEEEEENE